MISEMMRKAAGYNGAPVGERQALLSGGADTIDALATALAVVKDALLKNDPRQIGPILRKIDAALALARNGGSNG